MSKFVLKMLEEALQTPFPPVESFGRSSSCQNSSGYSFAIFIILLRSECLRLLHTCVGFFKLSWLCRWTLVNFFTLYLCLELTKILFVIIITSHQNLPDNDITSLCTPLVCGPHKLNFLQSEHLPGLKSKIFFYLSFLLGTVHQPWVISLCFVWNVYWTDIGNEAH